jgi:hypothetical protein
MKSAVQGGLQQARAPTVFELVRVEHKENSDGPKAGDAGQLVKKQGAFLVPDLRLPEFLQRIHHHHVSVGGAPLQQRLLDGSRPAAHRRLPQAASGQSGVERFNGLSQSRQDPFRMPGGEDDEPGARLLPMQDGDRLLHEFRKVLGARAGQDAGEPRRDFLIQEPGETHPGRFIRGGTIRRVFLFQIFINLTN